MHDVGVQDVSAARREPMSAIIQEQQHDLPMISHQVDPGSSTPDHSAARLCISFPIAGYVSDSNSLPSYSQLSRRHLVYILPFTSVEATFLADGRVMLLCMGLG